MRWRATPPYLTKCDDRIFALECVPVRVFALFELINEKGKHEKKNCVQSSSHLTQFSQNRNALKHPLLKLRRHRQRFHLVQSRKLFRELRFGG